LTTGFDLDAHAPVWAADGSRLFFTSETRGTVQIYEAPLERPVRQITDGVHDYGGFAVAIAAGRAVLVASRMSMSEPSDLYRVDPQSGEAAPLTTVNADLLRTLTLGRVERRMVLPGGRALDSDPPQRHPLAPRGLRVARATAAAGGGDAVGRRAVIARA
jgi:hypothetical protein